MSNGSIRYFQKFRAEYRMWLGGLIICLSVFLLIHQEACNHGFIISDLRCGRIEVASYGVYKREHLRDFHQ